MTPALPHFATVPLKKASRLLNHSLTVIGEVVAAWADGRVFRDGHWQFDTAPAELRTLHYVAGGQFYAIGESVVV